LEEWEPCPVLASYALAFALQLRKKHGKTSVRVAASKNVLKNSNIAGPSYMRKTYFMIKTFNAFK
jgi:hypothetical protein